MMHGQKNIKKCFAVKSMWYISKRSECEKNYLMYNWSNRYPY